MNETKRTASCTDAAGNCADDVLTPAGGKHIQDSCTLGVTAPAHLALPEQAPRANSSGPELQLLLS